MESKKYLLEKLQSLKDCLNEADMRFNIAISKMNEITKRVHELEVERNISLREQFKHGLIGEYNREDEIYQEVIKGYRAMSNRKNVLEEERNYYVKEIEDLKCVILQSQ